jgi:hypothetical protein
MLPTVTSEEMAAISDDEVRGLLVEAGMDVADLDKVQSGEAIHYPAMPMQLWTYKEALIRWYKAGRPKRTQEEVEQIHSEHCKPCEWYDKDSSRCKGCGCAVTTGSIAVFNKIKMGTEHCPKEKW